MDASACKRQEPAPAFDRSGRKGRDYLEPEIWTSEERSPNVASPGEPRCLEPVPPAETTRARRSTPRQVVDSVAVVATVNSPFSGRESQMAILREHLDAASSGLGSVVLVEGDAGMGKSRLLEETAREACGRRFRVGNC